MVIGQAPESMHAFPLEWFPRRHPLTYIDDTSVGTASPIADQIALFKYAIRAFKFVLKTTLCLT